MPTISWTLGQLLGHEPFLERGKAGLRLTCSCLKWTLSAWEIAGPFCAVSREETGLGRLPNLWRCPWRTSLRFPPAGASPRPPKKLPLDTLRHVWQHGPAPK